MKNKLKAIQITRFVVQLIFFISFTGVFSLTFGTLKKIFKMIFNGQVVLNSFITDFLAIMPVIILTVIMGRFFCGWLCAFGSMNDFLFLLGKKVFKHKIRVNKKVNRTLKYLKYIILIGIIFIIWIFEYTGLDSLDIWSDFARLNHLSSIIKETPLSALILILVMFGAVFIERFFCRYLCPLGAILAILSRIKLFRMKRKSEFCNKCKFCTSNCPMGIEVGNMAEIKTGECISCLRCKYNCGGKKLNLVVLSKKIRCIAYIIIGILIFSSLYLGGTLLDKYVVRESNITSGNLVIDSSQETGDMDDKEMADLSNDMINKNYKDGVYTGTADGYSPGIKVNVSIRKNKIIYIKIVSHNETSGYYEEAFRKIPERIIGSQSLKVDTISGATYSSRGIINAVSDALKKAQK